MNTVKRIPIIDLIRFASIVVVIGGHFYPDWVASFAQSEVVRRLIVTFFRNSLYGVTCFFVVSGFLITQMLVEKVQDLSTIDLKSFYVRRAARIFPLLLLVILTGFVIEQNFGLFDARFEHYNTWRDGSGFGRLFWLSLLSFNFNWYVIARHATLGGHWHVIWSLAVEEQFYFCFPWVLKFLKSREKVFLFLGFVIVSAFVFRFWALSYFDANSFLIHDASFGAFDQIAIGSGLYFLNERMGNWLQKHSPTACLLLVLGTTGCFYLFLFTSSENGFHSVVVPPLLALSCAATILGGLHLPALYSKPVQILAWPGMFSYGCYLWHSSLIVLLMPVLFSLGGLWGSAFLLLTVFLFAFLSYRFFELPVNHRIRGWFKLKISSAR